MQIDFNHYIGQCVLGGNATTQDCVKKLMVRGYWVEVTFFYNYLPYAKEIFNIASVVAEDYLEKITK